MALAPWPTVRSQGGMVATADHLATTAGILMLARGGSAVDAAIAANAVLAVCDPHLCGMGGDLFALVHDGGPTPIALNASGHAGSGADPDRLRAEGRTTMPFRRDIRSVPVPGCVDGWLTLHARYGRIDRATVFGPAISYAEGGFPVSPLLVASAADVPAPIPAGAEDLFGRWFRPGERLTRPGAGRTLRAIAALGREAFYGGEFGRGLLTLGSGEYTDADLERSQADWVDAVGLEAFGHRVWTVPPNSQGYLIPAGAFIASGLDLPDSADDPAWIHLLVEAAKAVGASRPARLFDGADPVALLDPAVLSGLRAGIGPTAAATVAPGSPGDTTYLCAVDADGLAVSLIQSNASGFGSHLVEPATGINLHNRGIGFSLEPGHPAEYGPGRRPPHTLSPALVTRPDGRLSAVLGTQGGDGQPQIVLQLLARLYQLGQHPGSAMAAPRAVLTGGGQGFDTWTSGRTPTVVIEGHAPETWRTDLLSRGHRVETGRAFTSAFGHAQVIAVDDDGLVGATDPRAVIGSVAGL